MAVRLRAAPDDEVAAALARRSTGAADPADEKMLVKHFLAVLARDHAGSSVEVRVPPYAVVQCVAGARHARGTPPAVVETDADTWLALAVGARPWSQAVATGRLIASGERSDLSALLPLPLPPAAPHDRLPR